MLRHPRPMRAVVGLLFGMLCLHFGGLVWDVALLLGLFLVSWGIW